LQGSYSRDVAVSWNDMVGASKYISIYLATIRQMDTHRELLKAARLVIKYLKKMTARWIGLNIMYMLIYPGIQVPVYINPTILLSKPLFQIHIQLHMFIFLLHSMLPFPASFPSLSNG
jgi:hypothetical protein